MNSAEKVRVQRHVFLDRRRLLRIDLKNPKKKKISFSNQGKKKTYDEKEEIFDWYLI